MRCKFWPFIYGDCPLCRTRLFDFQNIIYFRYASVQSMANKFKTKRDKGRSEETKPYKKSGTKMSERLKPKNKKR